MKTKPAKPAPKPAAKPDPKSYGRSQNCLPPCAIPLSSVGNGLFRLPEGTSGDNSGGVKGRISKIRDYLRTMPITSHPSRQRLEEVMILWGHPPERVQEIYKDLELPQAPENEEEEMP